jgi:DNA-binding transcriptional LysR family regulator
MELRQLEQFVAVAEERHFARAAARCDVVPSAVSTAVRVLERELGVVLMFLAEARKVLAAAAFARTSVGDMRNLLRGSLRVGGIPTFGLLDQPALLHRMHQMHPGLAIRYTRGTSTALLEDVHAGRLDVAVLSLPEFVPADLSVVEIARGQVLMACHSGHRLADRESVCLNDLAAECFVAPEPGSRGRDYIDRIFARAGVQPNVPYEVNDVATMLDFIETGLGVGLVIEPIAVGRRGLRAIPIEEHVFTWRVGVVAPSAEQLVPAARALLELITTAEPVKTQRPGTATTATPKVALARV